MAKARNPYNLEVPAVAQALKMLAALAENNPGEQTLTRLSALVGIHKSKGYSILNTLSSFGMVVRNPSTKGYLLGPGVLSLSRAYLEAAELRKTAEPFLKELAKKTGCTALLGVPGGERFTIIAREEFKSGIGVTIRVGQSYPSDWGVYGKLMAAHYAGDGEGDPELRETRKSGLATETGGIRPGITSSGALVIEASGEPLACVITVGTHPPEETERIGRLTLRAAREISRTAAGG